jgi:hypothetical protein
MKQLVLLFAGLSLVSGCTVTTRYVTGGVWRTHDGAATPTAAPATDGAGGDAASGPPAVSVTTAAGGARSYYVTMWEGDCGGAYGLAAAFGGSRCSKGNGKIMRCDLQADNSLKCVEETEANKALSTD